MQSCHQIYESKSRFTYLIKDSMLVYLDNNLNNEDPIIIATCKDTKRI